MTKYKDRKGNIVELTLEEFVEYPFNSRLTKIDEEEKKPVKKVIRRNDNND